MVGYMSFQGAPDISSIRTKTYERSEQSKRSTQIHTNDSKWDARQLLSAILLKPLGIVMI